MARPPQPKGRLIALCVFGVVAFPVGLVFLVLAGFVAYKWQNSPMDSFPAIVADKRPHRSGSGGFELDLVLEGGSAITVSTQRSVGESVAVDSVGVAHVVADKVLAGFSAWEE